MRERKGERKGEREMERERGRERGINLSTWHKVYPVVTVLYDRNDMSVVPSPAI